MNRRHGFFATGVDDMGRAKALRKGKLFVIKVHGNDRIRTRHPRTDHGG